MTVVVREAPVEPLEKLPMRALAIWSPAATWNAEVLDVNASCWPPLASVWTEATMPAALSALSPVALPFPSFWIAELMFFTRPAMSDTPEELTETFTPLKPAPENSKIVAPKLVLTAFKLVVSVRILDTDVLEELPRSAVPTTACMPFRPRLWLSTVAVLRSTFTAAFDRLWLPLPSPKYTARLLAEVQTIRA